MPPRPVDHVHAIPTKQFFVSMLTRDISLADAILDLVDNCLDGALRIADGGDVDYSRHTVDINFSADQFSITDNCGGIPRKIAIEYAFKMGRDPDDTRDSETETIGMYGVGMKRAIFKMGRDAVVQSRNDNDPFDVHISSEWLDDKAWRDLPLTDSETDDALLEHGTRIRVSELNPSISKHFQSAAFSEDLQKNLSEHFTTFLQRGLNIRVNDVPVRPIRVEILTTDDVTRPAPYVFKKKIHDVWVYIAVGLNKLEAPSDEDYDPESQRTGNVDIAGWTIFCNDRAVIVGDKSRLTGWGDTIPLYHPQFSILTGIVEFRSNTAAKLPVTTTKRALDTTSEVWLEALREMKRGMRVWITYTNAWKNRKRAEMLDTWGPMHSLPVREMVDHVVRTRSVPEKSNAYIFDPARKNVLPKPPGIKPTSRRIVFTRTLEEIRRVSNYLFEASDQEPKVIGEKCFDIIHKEAEDEEASHE